MHLEQVGQAGRSATAQASRDVPGWVQPLFFFSFDTTTAQPETVSERPRKEKKATKSHYQPTITQVDGSVSLEGPFAVASVGWFTAAQTFDTKIPTSMSSEIMACIILILREREREKKGSYKKKDIENYGLKIRVSNTEPFYQRWFDVLRRPPLLSSLPPLS